MNPDASAPLPTDPPRALIVGTAHACGLLLRQLEVVGEAAGVMGVVGVVLTESQRPGSVEGAPVLGGIDELIGLCAAHEVTSAIVTLPAAERSLWRPISVSLHRAGVIERFVPPIDELLHCAPAVGAPVPTGVGGVGGVGASGVTIGAPKINLAELVGREAHAIDRELVGQTLTGKTVLVTGAGGSIGSELVRQVASYQPGRIILMERAENALFEVDRHLRESRPEIDRAAVLHDVVDASRTLSLLERYRPQVVFHAAAHKHVPLMEDHPAHAVTNNLFGTKAIADASVAVGAERFVLISSDKAVNPVSVMGATKRLAEMYVQSLARGVGSGAPVATRLSMVRFGNVLGSACSVLPIWADQIASGRPVTVTDERMTRYFMTIPEAATLVLQAGAMSGHGFGGIEIGRSGEVFVLDMGEPINIFNLAKRFIRACGYEAVIGQPMGGQGASNAVPIVLSGARPGEKLYEELSYDAQGLMPTSHRGIYALDETTDVSTPTIDDLIASMDRVRRSQSRKAVLGQIARFIPTMNGEVGSVSAA